MPPEALMTAGEVSEYLRCSVSMVRRMVRRSEIPHLRLGRLVRFRRREVDAWLSRRQEGAGSGQGIREPADHPDQLFLFGGEMGRRGASPPDGPGAGQAPQASKDPRIRRAAVLGAGVMGSRIAALLANAGIEVDLLDLPDGADKAGRARAGLEKLRGLRPCPLFMPEVVRRIRPGSLDDAGAIARAQWVIEAVVEDPQVKRSLFEGIRRRLGSSAVLTSNTSGLSIASLAEGLPRDVQRRFFGVHFFNPPRYMKLVEVIPGPATDPSRVEELAAFLRNRLGKGVVSCRDTPNFIANRLGLFAVMDALRRMEASGLTVEEVDAVTGPILGRPRSATLRLCDLIGLDTLVHVAGTARDRLDHDPWRGTFEASASLLAMVDAGLLGEKAGGGFYRRGGSGTEAIDPATREYHPVTEVKTSLPSRGDLGGRLAAVTAAAGGDRLARFARDHLFSTLSYCAACAAEVSDSLEAIDRVLRWGFNWEAGPFEQIDLIGADALIEGLEDGTGPPELLLRIAAAGRVYGQGAGEGRVLTADGGGYRPLSPEGPPGDAQRLAAAEVVRECETARLIRLGDGAGVVELRGKLNVLGPDSLAFVRDAVSEGGFDLLVLTGAGENLSAGADLRYLLDLIDDSRWAELDSYLRLFQQATLRVRYAPMPVVTAARGLALGGGCEFNLAASSRVVAAELRLGLVETRIGVVPGAGGCKEMVRRFGAGVDAFLPILQAGRMSDNALEARSWGFLDGSDLIRLDGERLLEAAVTRARELLAGGWSPPRPQALAVAGPGVLEGLHAEIEAGAGEGRLSAHDVVVGKALARVVCGGGARGTISEEGLLDLEREAFLQLCGTPATRARIAHMLATGRPLRN